MKENHRFIKKSSMAGVKSFHTAKSILLGIEAMYFIKKGQFCPKISKVYSPTMWNGCIRTNLLGIYIYPSSRLNFYIRTVLDPISLPESLQKKQHHSLFFHFEITLLQDRRLSFLVFLL